MRDFNYFEDIITISSGVKTGIPLFAKSLTLL